jgi:transposase
MKQWHDESWLREKYHEEGLDMNEIGEACGVTGKTIQYWFNKHDIERKARGTPSDGKYTEKSWLKKQYFDEGKSLREIADLCGVSKTTIRRWCRRHNIKLGGSGRKYADEKWSNEEWVREQYVEKEKPISQIASECSTVNSTIHRALVRFGIERRDHADHLLKPQSERAPKTRGSGWRKARRESLERADFACENPFCDEDSDSLEHSLHVHHIVPFRVCESDEEANSLSNLLVLCPQCHRDIEPPKSLLEPVV